MTETMQTAVPPSPSGATLQQSGNMGLVKGVPGRFVENVGVLDLRGVGAEDLKQIEVLQNIGAVLVDSEQSAALTHVRLINVGAMKEVPADCRVQIDPWQEFSRATVEAMPPGQKLLLVGLVLFRSDVPPALIAEKFDELHIVGILFAPAGVHGALLGKSQITGVTVPLPDEEVTVIPSVGQNAITPGYLKYIADDSLYINIGRTVIDGQVPEELLAQKFGTYLNIGLTVAPKALLDLLRARCSTNMGHFAEPEEEKADA